MAKVLRLAACVITLSCFAEEAMADWMLLQDTVVSSPPVSNPPIEATIVEVEVMDRCINTMANGICAVEYNYVYVLKPRPKFDTSKFPFIIERKVVLVNPENGYVARLIYPELLKAAPKPEAEVFYGRIVLKGKPPLISRSQKRKRPERKNKTFEMSLVQTGIRAVRKRS